MDNKDQNNQATPYIDRSGVLHQSEPVVPANASEAEKGFQFYSLLAKKYSRFLYCRYGKICNTYGNCKNNGRL